MILWLSSSNFQKITVVTRVFISGAKVQNSRFVRFWTTLPGPAGEDPLDPPNTGCKHKSFPQLSHVVGGLAIRVRYISSIDTGTLLISYASPPPQSFRSLISESTPQFFHPHTNFTVDITQSIALKFHRFPTTWRRRFPVLPTPFNRQQKCQRENQLEKKTSTTSS